MLSRRCKAVLIGFFLLTLPDVLLAEPQAIPGEYLIKYKNVSSADKQEIRSNLRTEALQKTSIVGAELIKTKPGQELNKYYAKALLAAGMIEYIEPNYVIHINRTPNDSSYAELWGMNNTGQTGGSNDVDIDAPEAWDVTTGATGNSAIVVGIVDTGINYNHPDLAENIWTNPNEIPGNGIDDDNNGVIDDIHGYNAIDNSGDPLDDHGHGSHCAGTIGGVGNDGSGVVGVNWNVKMLGLKFLNAQGFGSTLDAVEAIEYAIALKNSGVNLKVLNNSWGGDGFSQALLDAIEAAEEAGILFVAAAGNNGNNNDALPTYPANYDIENIISVAAIDHDGNLASFSNYGASTVDVAAPGVNILSTVTGSGYASWSGTSMATPHVSGVAALLLGNQASLSISQVKDRLMNTAKPLASLTGQMLAAGIVSAKNSLSNTRTPLPTPEDLISYNKAAIGIQYDTNQGTRILQNDDGYYTTDLAFSFPYYNGTFSKIVVSANGRILPIPANGSAPTESDFSNFLSKGISPYHDDLFPSPFSSDKGVWLKSDSSSVTVTWVVVNYAHRLSSDITKELRFQAKIYSTGEVQFHYLDTQSNDALFDYGASATVGLATAQGTAGKTLNSFTQ